MGARPAAQAQKHSPNLDWGLIEASVEQEVEAARAEAEARGVSSPDRVTDHVFFDGEASQVGGGAGLSLDGTTEEPQPEGQRINMVTAIRRVLDQELDGKSRRCWCSARMSGRRAASMR